MAYIGPTGSTVAYQGTVPFSVVGTTTGSIVSVQQGSVATVIIGGSIAASFTPPANQSVSGTVAVSNFPTSQNVNGSVVAFQGGAPWATTNVGSVVSYSQGSIAAVIIGGSIASAGVANQSVSGTVGASIIGLTPVVVSNFPTTQNVSGSVVATQGTNPWTVVSSLAGGIFPVSGSVAAVITNFPTTQNISGSVIAFQGGTQVTSLVSTVPSSVLVGASIFGQLPAGTAMLGSVAAYQGAVWNVAGSVAAFQAGAWSASIQTMTLTSIATAGQVIGSVVALQGTNPWVVNFANSSILAVPIGSVITLNQGSSILAVPVGSVITVFQAPSIVGTYAEDSTHTSGDKGVFSLHVRNDTMSSITSADTDYSPFAVGPVGELITANAPLTKWVYGTNSIVSGASVALIAAQGTSIFTYISGLNIVNQSPNNLTGNLSTGAGASSILVYWTAPANGGSNMVFPNPIRGRSNVDILASISGVGSILISAQGFISKT